MNRVLKLLQWDKKTLLRKVETRFFFTNHWEVSFFNCHGSVFQSSPQLGMVCSRQIVVIVVVMLCGIDCPCSSAVSNRTFLVGICFILHECYLPEAIKSYSMLANIGCVD